MTSDAPQKDDQTQKIDFTTRAVAAWMLFIIPGILVSLICGQGLVVAAIGTTFIAPVFILVYDISQFLKRTWRRSKKLIILPLVGLSLAIIFSTVGTQIQLGRANLAEAQNLIAQTGSAGSDLEGLRSSSQSLHRAASLLDSVPAIPGAGRETAQSTLMQIQEKLADTDIALEIEEQKAQRAQQAVTALEPAKSLARQASEIVQQPPHPLSVWKAADQKWTQAVQHLESIPRNVDVYDEAIDKLVSYRGNQTAIAQRIKTEESAATSYETGRVLIDELVEMTQSLDYPKEKDLPILKQVSAKLESELQAFRAIPSGTASSDAAQKRLSSHNNDYQSIQRAIETLETCDPDRIIGCTAYSSVEMSIFTDSENTYGNTPIRSARRGSCDCPYDRDSRGNSCGRRSAYSRPGGASPMCYR